MIEKKLLENLKNNYSQNGNERRKIISVSNDILFKAKKAIFAIQKFDEKSAEGWFKEMEESFKNLEKTFGAERLIREGAYKAAAEEYMEGKTLWQAVRGKDIEATKGISFDYESYLGGICDMIGELVRYATNQAATGKFTAVAKIKKIAENTMEELADFDMTGYLRTKYDQARGHLRKIEQMAYEIRLRGKK
jgi:predicted translin family RNA/ssDNA-binding protein